MAAMTAAIPQPEALRVYLNMIGGGPGRYVELRAKQSRGMAQDFTPTRDRKGTARLLNRIVQLGAETDVYVGAAPREREQGTADAIELSYTLWADCDSPAAVAALESFSPAPAVVVLSGGVTEGVAHRHAYWPLHRPLTRDAAVRANRRLAHALGADMCATDAARILRPPGTMNHKACPPRPVKCIRLEIVSYTATEVVGELPDAPERKPKTTIRQRQAPLSPYADALQSIPAVEYVPALTGREIDTSGKVRCPFHSGGRECTPSLHVYEPPIGPGSWYCFGCSTGGSIIDFGAALYGLEPRRRGFHEIRRRLAADLLGWTEAA